MGHALLYDDVILIFCFIKLYLMKCYNCCITAWLTFQKYSTQFCRLCKLVSIYAVIQQFPTLHTVDIYNYPQDDRSAKERTGDKSEQNQKAGGKFKKRESYDLLFVTFLRLVFVYKYVLF